VHNRIGPAPLTECGQIASSAKRKRRLLVEASRLWRSAAVRNRVFDTLRHPLT
jgi:hypothetical protein